jgi:hypothetical protein
MKFHAITDDETYAALLIDAETELSELIELVVVPETWLYRDAEAFAVATSVVQSRLQNQLGPVRILCLPCATGEEPYSLAMSLSDARIAPGDVTIEGVDISRAVVERAWRAVYGSNAFRTPDLDFRDRHFHEVEGGYALNARVRDMVTFRQVEDVRSPSIAAKNQLKGSRLVDNLAKKTVDGFFPPSSRRWERRSKSCPSRPHRALPLWMPAPRQRQSSAHRPSTPLRGRHRLLPAHRPFT